MISLLVAGSGAIDPTVAVQQAAQTAQTAQNSGPGALGAVSMVMLLLLLVPIMVFHHFEQKELEHRLT